MSTPRIPTFDPSRYLDIIVYRDGRIYKEEEEDLSYDRYLKELDEETEQYLDIAGRSYDPSIVLDALENIKSIEKLRDMLKDIWEIEDYEE